MNRIQSKKNLIYFYLDLMIIERYKRGPVTPVT